MLEMDERMRAELDEDGFTVLESFIQGEELERIRAAVLDVAKHGDGGLVSPIALEMMSYEPMLPYLVTAMGWNVHMRDGLMTSIAPAQEVHVDAGKLGTNWHVDQEEEFQGVTHDGTVPLMELKISYYLSDATEEDHACTMLIPGSHRWTPMQRATWEEWIAPEDVVPLHVPCGSVLLWRSTLLHSVSPHLSDAWRLHLMFSYVPRWFRPSYRGTFKNLATQPELLKRCTPIQQQLLGAIGDGEDDGLPRNSPLYLFPTKDTHVPLKAWAEAQAGVSLEQGYWDIRGPTGHGVSNVHALNRRVTPTMFGAGTDMQPEYRRPAAWCELRARRSAGGTGPNVPVDETPAQLKLRATTLELELRRLEAKVARLENSSSRL